MKKSIFLILVLSIYCLAHPVSYTIDLDIKYDEVKKEVKIICSSNSKNKCGLYNIRLLDEKNKELADKRFPFLKKYALIKSDVKPYKMEFYLRKVPEHIYTKIFE